MTRSELSEILLIGCSSSYHVNFGQERVDDRNDCQARLALTTLHLHPRLNIFIFSSTAIQAMTVILSQCCHCPLKKSPTVSQTAMLFRPKESRKIRLHRLKRIIGDTINLGAELLIAKKVSRALVSASSSGARKASQEDEQCSSEQSRVE